MFIQRPFGSPLAKEPPKMDDDAIFALRLWYHTF